MPIPYLHVDQTKDRTLDRHLTVAALLVVDPGPQVKPGGSYTGMSKLVLQVIEWDTSIQSCDGMCVS